MKHYIGIIKFAQFFMGSTCANSPNSLHTVFTLIIHVHRQGSTEFLCLTSATVLNLIEGMEKNNFNFEKRAFFW